jgi:hypothetical protein
MVATNLCWTSVRCGIITLRVSGETLKIDQGGVLRCARPLMAYGQGAVKTIRLNNDYLLKSCINIQSKGNRGRSQASP